MGSQLDTVADCFTDLMRWLCPEAICKAALLARFEEVKNGVSEK